LTAITPLNGHGLYAVTDGPRPDLLDVVAQALAGGASVVQYRDDTDDHHRRRIEAAGLKNLCRKHGALLIVDADIALAKDTGADGVHLGPEQADIDFARRQLGAQAIVGVSCLASLERATAAASNGASYISFGAFFTSPTKPLAGHASIDLLRQTAALGLPRVAIGGITPDNGRLVVDAGAEFVAAVSGLFGTPDVRAAAQRYTDLYFNERDHGTPA
jgi:thiamine-phosphate pyrophosphorylase